MSKSKKTTTKKPQPPEVTYVDSVKSVEERLNRINRSITLIISAGCAGLEDVETWSVSMDELLGAIVEQAQDAKDDLRLLRELPADVLNLPALTDDQRAASAR